MGKSCQNNGSPKRNLWLKKLGASTLGLIPEDMLRVQQRIERKFVRFRRKKLGGSGFKGQGGGERNDYKKVRLGYRERFFFIAAWFLK